MHRTVSSCVGNIREINDVELSSNHRSFNIQQNSNFWNVLQISEKIIGLIAAAVYMSYVIFFDVTVRDEDRLYDVFTCTVLILYFSFKLDIYRQTIGRITALIIDIFQENFYRDLLNGIITLLIILHITILCFDEPRRIGPVIFGSLLLIISVTWNFFRYNEINLHYSVLVRCLNLHYILAIVFVYCPLGRQFISYTNRIIVQYVKFSEIGTILLYGEQHPCVTLAFYILPSIYLTYLTTVILIHIGTYDYLINVSQRLAFLLGLSPLEGTYGLLNFFILSNETCHVMRGSLISMNHSEIFGLIVSCLSTISFGTIFSLGRLGADIDCLLTSSLLTLPCSFAFSRIFIPSINVIEYSVRSEIEPLRNMIQLNGQDSTNQFPSKNLLEKCHEAIGRATASLQWTIGYIVAVTGAVVFIDRVIEALMYPFFKDMGLLRILSSLLGPGLKLIFFLDDNDGNLLAEILTKRLLTNEFLAYDTLSKMKQRFTAERTTELANLLLSGSVNLTTLIVLTNTISSFSKLLTSTDLKYSLVVSLIINMYCTCTIAIFSTNY